MTIPLQPKGLTDKNDVTQTGNYRPISLFNIINKVFDKIMYFRLYKFLSKHKILYTYQFGFRENHSTSVALIKIVDYVKQTFEDQNYTLDIHFDLTKAFDTVDYKYNHIIKMLLKNPCLCILEKLKVVYFQKHFCHETYCSYSYN